MDLNLIWVQDPNSKQPSTSLTLVMLSAGILVVAIGLEMSGLVKNTSMCMEFFGMSCGLHFGKHWVSSKGQSLDNTEVK